MICVGAFQEGNLSRDSIFIIYAIYKIVSGRASLPSEGILVLHALCHCVQPIEDCLDTTAIRASANILGLDTYEPDFFF